MMELMTTTKEALAEVRDALVGCALGFGAAHFLEWLF